MVKNPANWRSLVLAAATLAGLAECYERSVENADQVVDRVRREQQRIAEQARLVADQLPAVVAESDLGVLTEKPIYEGMLGSKNRVVQWMSSGLAVAYNDIGDLGELLDNHRLGLTFPVGDAETLADRLCWAADHPQEVAAMAQRACRFAQEHLSFKATTTELLAWAANPTFAPDLGFRPGEVKAAAAAAR